MSIAPFESPSIGVFDSGVGGLTVLRELRSLLPHSALHYLADAAYAPYGTRTPEEIRARSRAITAHLLAQGARMVVIACNTATAHAIDDLRAQWPQVQFVGTEPGIKPAVALTRNGRIGLLATPSTAGSDRLRALIARHGGTSEFVVQGCAGVVDCIEAGDLDSPRLSALVDRYCEPLRMRRVDTVLLGCTHYPLIQPLWEAAMGPDVRVVRIEVAVARRACDLWAEPTPAAPRMQIETSGDPAALQRWISHVLGWQDTPVHAWHADTERA
ncbi:glutamate racemase [Roseateles sp. BYS87W]|uniref:Glutamate racemase n=1 Tax=Pelomonas baiyunensis TaxID=3299026 RepID=A0ABW7GVB2_9BURK